jgi:hypothetical protein
VSRADARTQAPPPLSPPPDAPQTHANKEPTTAYPYRSAIWNASYAWPNLRYRGQLMRVHRSSRGVSSLRDICPIMLCTCPHGQSHTTPRPTKRSPSQEALHWASGAHLEVQAVTNCAAVDLTHPSLPHRTPLHVSLPTRTKLALLYRSSHLARSSGVTRRLDKSMHAGE